MKKVVYCLFLIFFTIVSEVDAKTIHGDYPKDKIISNRMFSLVIPGMLKGTYEIKKDKITISVYEKDSLKAGFGGFAFGIRAYKNPKDHANLPGSKKIGELVDKKKNLYDIVLKYPTDVQYDYTKEEPMQYKILYNLGEIVEIKGKEETKYYKARGTKGEDLYQEILEKHIRAIKEKWNTQKLDEENISNMYSKIANKKNALDSIGYVYFDINGDGIDELLIGGITQGMNKGIIYDIYTMADRKPIHVISGDTKNRYFTNGYFFIKEYSPSANENIWLTYILLDNSNELYPQVGFKQVATINKIKKIVKTKTKAKTKAKAKTVTNSTKSSFIMYNFEGGQWEAISERDFSDRKEPFDKYKRFNFIPLSSYN